MIGKARCTECGEVKDIDLDFKAFRWDRKETHVCCECEYWKEDYDTRMKRMGLKEWTRTDLLIMAIDRALEEERMNAECPTNDWALITKGKI